MARRQYLAPVNKQHPSVQAYVRNNWNDLREYGLNHSGPIEAEKARAHAERKRYLGHKMNFARGDLRDAYVKSRGKATGGGKVSKELARLRRIGSPSSAAKIKKLLTNLHAVKYISGEPNHR